MIRRFYCVMAMILAVTSVALATHNRAGEITYRQISDLTFEVTVTTFTYTLSKVFLC